MRRFLVLAWGIVLCAVAGVFFLQEGREHADQWASVFGFFLNAASVSLTAYTVWGLRPGLAPAQGRPDTEYLENLAAVMRGSYATEAATRRLQDPDVLPVDWRFAEADLMDHPRNIWFGADPPVPRSTSSMLDTYLQVPTRRLVVLGRAGSGKSVAALTFAIDALAVRLPAESVPVVLPVSTWDPHRQGFRDWICTSLIEVDPRLAEVDRDGVSWARRLVERRAILAVLDGLDELPVRIKGNALQTLNAELDRNEPIVMTCRTEQFRAAIAFGDVLTGAAVIQLQPLRQDSLASYLPRTTRPSGEHGATKWEPVLQQLRERPRLRISQSIASVLSTPLMVWLARVQYSDTDADPQELLRPEFADEQALRTHLLDGFVAAAYADRGGHPSRRVSAAAAERWLIQLAGLMRSNGTSNLRWWQLGNGVPLSLMRTALAVTAGMASATTVMIITGLAEGLWRGLVVGLVLGAAVGAAVTMIPWLRQAPEPSAVAPSVRTQQLAKAGVFAVMALVPAGVGVLADMATMSPALNAAKSQAWVLVAAVALSLTVIVALVASPVETDRMVDPLRLLRADRISAAAQGCLIGFATGLLAATAAWTSLPAAAAVTIGTIFAVSSGLVWAIAGSAWGRFAVIRLYWWSRQRLPLRLMTFLDDAHRRGILRQVGATYQFRHDLLQARLAARS